MLLLLFAWGLVSAAALSADWELVVSGGESVELVSVEGEVVGARGSGVPQHAASLALDPLSGTLFLADPGHPNTSIFALPLRAGPPSTPRPIVPRTARVAGVAFDPLAGALYWTTERAVVRLGLGPDTLENQAPELVHNFTSELPHGIAVDPCRRQLYWTNCNMSSPTIERSELDGSGRQVLVSTELYQPLGLTLSHSDGWLYWADERSGSRFRIERVRLDGTDRQLVVSSINQQPVALAILPGVSVYWTDLMYKAVWRVSVNSSLPVETPAMVRRYSEPFSPRGILSLTQVLSLDSQNCSALHHLKDKVGNWTWEGEVCPNDYCLHGGECWRSRAGELRCDCPEGFLGDRCHLPARLCAAVCLDSVTTVMDPSLAHICRCDDVSKDEVEHRRCPVPRELNAWRLTASVLIVCLFILAIVTTFLAIKTVKLSKRPKLRRRYTSNKKPSASQPPPAHCTDQIEIENCCNMNICETPCYEPELRAGSGRKEEKRSLIDAMEAGESSPPPCLPRTPSF